jgi:hypothetical protein
MPSSNSSNRNSYCQEVSFKQYVFMKWLLDSNFRGVKDLHIKDLKTTWFGVPQEQAETHRPQLYIWNRPSAVVTQDAEAPQRQYPSLVSFVGDTGSGKSTLIRALIHMLEPVHHDENEVPVPGGVSQTFVSTSGDVHLYADPHTRSRKAPLYFAGQWKPFPCYHPTLSTQDWRLNLFPVFSRLRGAFRKRGPRIKENHFTGVGKRQATRRLVRNRERVVRDALSLVFASRKARQVGESHVHVPRHDRKSPGVGGSS